MSARTMSLAEARARRLEANSRRMTDDQIMRFTVSRDRLLRESAQLAAEGDAAMLAAHRADDPDEASQHALRAVGRYAQAEFRRTRARYAQERLDARGRAA